MAGFSFSLLTVPRPGNSQIIYSIFTRILPSGVAFVMYKLTFYFKKPNCRWFSRITSLYYYGSLGSTAEACPYQNFRLLLDEKEQFVCSHNISIRSEVSSVFLLSVLEVTIEKRSYTHYDPEKQDKTLELSKHWSPDSTPARNEVKQEIKTIIVKK